MYLDYPDTIGFQGKMNIEFLQWVLDIYRMCVSFKISKLIPILSISHRIRDHFVHALSQGDMTLLWALAAKIAKFIGPTWDQSGADRIQVDPMLAPWTLLWECLIRWKSFMTWMDMYQSILKIETMMNYAGNFESQRLLS